MKPIRFSLFQKLCSIAIAVIFVHAGAKADTDIEWHASLTAQASSKTLAPYMLGSWNYGRYVEGSGIWQEAGLSKPLDLSRRFSWSAGIDYIAGVAAKTHYDRWDASSSKWTSNVAHMPYVRLQQLFAEIKYRSVFLNVGMKQTHSVLIDDRLSSGDLVRSNNAAPIPGISAGFLDFQDIPFTNGWVQIDGEIMYGKMMDSGFKKSEFNLYSGVEAINLWYNYKRCYFRTNPDKPFHVTVGMQAAGMFGGSSRVFQKGEVTSSVRRGFRLKDAIQMFIPIEDGGEAYYTGNHLGSWDLKACYRFRDGSKLNAYFEWPWEDGSGIGKMNGWDGLWGVQYEFSKRGAITKALFEYLDFTNQSGPIHFDPDDVKENPISGHAQGGDNYYNNDFYGAYSNYGMSIGTPFLVSPIYNLNGALGFLHNKGRGFHAAVEGSPCDIIDYRAMVGYELAGGSGWTPAFKRLHSVSAMVEAVSRPFRKLPGMKLSLRMALDTGTLRGNNFGAQIGVSYDGLFNL